MYSIVLFCANLWLLGTTYYFYSIHFKYIFIKKTLLLHEELTTIMVFSMHSALHIALGTFLFLFSYAICTHICIHTLTYIYTCMYVQNL